LFSSGVSYCNHEDKDASFFVNITPGETALQTYPQQELKSISGEDAVDIHRKGLPPLTGVKLPTRIVIVSNDPPKFCDPSGALDRRIMSPHTHRSFCGQEDITLTNTLLRELPGILNWAIEGWERLQSRGCFEAPQPVHLDPTKLLQALPDQSRVRRIVIQYQDERRRPRHHRRWSARRLATEANLTQATITGPREKLVIHRDKYRYGGTPHRETL
jgi:hypothetical protein